jgi:predicted ABC-class ATPase
VRPVDELRGRLIRIDGRGYKAYKEIRGSYDAGGIELHIDHIQGDPFAAPSKVRIRLHQEVPADLIESPIRRIALEDHIAREVERTIRRTVQGRRGTGKSGLVAIDAGGQEVIQRTAVAVTPEWTEARLHVGLPAAGRRVLGRQAEAVLCRELPAVAREGLPVRESARPFVDAIDLQERIRSKLDEQGLVAFVADGAILPRESGASDRPMKDAVPFRSPEKLRVTLEGIEGMGIPRGVTLIVGGGYHGKSTLLQALQNGVYPHIPGDGRDRVVTSPDTVKVRAEDGRRVERADISPFIRNLPQDRSTTAFSTDDASGSTSQAANIVEAVEVGAKVLLLDEDTSATNFMVRDARMQALVHRDHEPITPFVDRVRGLYEKLGVSTVLVMGGSGDYFEAADTVVMMREFLPNDVTEEARRITTEHETRRRSEVAAPLERITPRIPLSESFDPSRGRREVKIDARALDLIQFGTESIDLRGIEQIVDPSQTRAIGYALHLASNRFMDGRAPLSEVVERIEAFFDREGLDPLDPFHRAGQHPGNFARPRRYEIAAAINRLRTMTIRQAP